MIGNPLPWIIIAAVVLVTLVYKGQIKLPSTRPPGYMTPPVPAATPAHVDPFNEAPVNIEALVKFGSYALGVALAKAVRAEAESTIAHQMAAEATRAIHAKFTDPFSEPGPAGQDRKAANPSP